MKFIHFIAGAALLLPAGIVNAQSASSETESNAAAPAAEAETTAGADQGSTAGAAQQGAGAEGAVQATPATEADLAKGAVVSDPAGKPVGTVDSTTSDGVVLTVGDKKFQIPRTSIGKNGTGLVTTVTREWLESAAAKQSAS